MSRVLSYARHFLPWLLAAGGIDSLWIALRRFDRLGLLDGYHLPEYRRFPVHRTPGVLLPFAAGLLLLIVAAVLFLRTHNHPESAILDSKWRRPEKPRG